MQISSLTAPGAWSVAHVTDTVRAVRGVAVDLRAGPPPCGQQRSTLLDDGPAPECDELLTGRLDAVGGRRRRWAVASPTALSS